MSPRPTGFLGADRGQTTQDYAIGVGVFLLTMAFAFALVPSVFSPFQTPVSSAETVGAQRIADQVRAEMTDDGGRLNATARDQFFAGTSGDELRDGYGLALGSHVNVSLVGQGRSVGHPYSSEPVVVARRVVVGPGCSPSCEIEVRVW